MSLHLFHPAFIDFNNAGFKLSPAFSLVPSARTQASLERERERERTEKSQEARINELMSMLAESKQNIKEKEGKLESLQEMHKQVVAENAEKVGRLSVLSAAVEDARRLREDIDRLQELLQTERVSAGKKLEKVSKEKEVSVPLFPLSLCVCCPLSVRYHYACDCPI